jgi:hypothetical protein
MKTQADQHPTAKARARRRSIPATARMFVGLSAGLGLALAMPAAADMPSAPAPEVYFISPADGERLNSPVTVRFGLRHMGVAPAGVEFPGSGHHHLIVDAPLPPLDAPVPADEHHRHFGKGQTETTLELPPGSHTLQLLMGDHLHRPHAPPVFSPVITIEVTTADAP